MDVERTSQAPRPTFSYHAAAMTVFLLAWHGYTAVLGLLMALSARRRSLVRAFGLGAAVAAVALGFEILLAYPAPPVVMLSAKWLIGGAGAAGLVAGGRDDTRLIALLLTGAAVLPLFLHYWQPPG
jgi:hypothetical protein